MPTVVMLVTAKVTFDAVDMVPKGQWSQMKRDLDQIKS